MALTHEEIEQSGVGMLQFYSLELGEEWNMIEDRILVREVVRSAPDGQSVTVQEVCEVQIRLPPGFEESPEKSYTLCGQWRLLPKAMKLPGVPA